MDEVVKRYFQLRKQYKNAMIPAYCWACAIIDNRKGVKYVVG